MLLAALLTAASWSLTPVNHLPLPASTPHGQPLGLSGLTRAADDSYYAVQDKAGGTCWSFQLGVDRANGSLTNAVVKGMVKLRGAVDPEGIVWDAATGWLWAADEHDNSIRAWLPSGAPVERVQMPKVFANLRFNFGLESLALAHDGKTLWTCNEDALGCDGPRATAAHGSLVRLQRFTRETPHASWRAAGQWVYPVDKLGGRDLGGKSCSGVSELLCLDDGTLLALEREMSIKKNALLPSLRCRIYQLDFTGATEVSAIESLVGRRTPSPPRRLEARVPYFRPVSKRRLYAANTGFAMYEGICLGPELVDGSRSVLMISDAGGGAGGQVMALRLESRKNK